MKTFDARNDTERGAREPKKERDETRGEKGEERRKGEKRSFNFRPYVARRGENKKHWQALPSPSPPRDDLFISDLFSLPRETIPLAPLFITRFLPFSATKDSERERKNDKIVGKFGREPGTLLFHRPGKDSYVVSSLGQVSA